MGIEKDSGLRDFEMFLFRDLFLRDLEIQGLGICGLGTKAFGFACLETNMEPLLGYFYTRIPRAF